MGLNTFNERWYLKNGFKGKAEKLLYDFKGDEYASGVGILNKVGEYTKEYGDYEVTKTMPLDVTVDGAFDGISHCLEVFYGIEAENYDLEKEIASTAVELIVKNTSKVVNDLQDTGAREALGLATDLGTYSIMVGGTNGGHLTSFSLVDITSHGRACGIMNIYYTVFFAPAIEPQLEMKLKNMPIPFDASLVDQYMAPILEAAKTGDLSLIKNMDQ